MSDLSDDAMYQVMEDSSSSTIEVMEPSVHDTRIEKPLTLPSTTRELVADPNDAEPDLILPFFKFFY